MPSIRTRLGFFLYLIRRNDRVWNSLSQQDRKLVMEANLLHNNVRPDYANPELYQGGMNFDSDENRSDILKGKELLKFLNKSRPTSVIEVGPGSGYLSAGIVTFPTVRSYTAIDIVQSFLDYLRPRLEKIGKANPNFHYQLLNGDFIQMNFEAVDVIILLSTVHHIPNRLDLLKWMNKNLKVHGRCLVFEPTHYLPRIRYLTGKYFRMYHKASHRAKTESFSTHHFCTLEEFESACKQVPELKINSYSFHRLDFPHFTRKALDRVFTLRKMPRDEDGRVYVQNARSALRFFSQRMVIEFIKVR